MVANGLNFNLEDVKMKKKLRVGMIGYGFMGKAHTNAFRQAAKFFPDLPYEPELKIFCARKPTLSPLGRVGVKHPYSCVFVNPKIAITISSKAV